MPLTAVPDLPADDSRPATGLTPSSLIDEIVREGAGNPLHRSALVRAPAHFERGRLVEREELAA